MNVEKEEMPEDISLEKTFNYCLDMTPKTKATTTTNKLDFIKTQNVFASNDTKEKTYMPWLVWLSGLSAGLRTKRSPVRFPVRAHAWVVGGSLGYLPGLW